MNIRESSCRIVLTGITRGLGRALFERFAESGHKVAGCGRSESAIRELREAYPHTHRFSVLDVRDRSAVMDWGEDVLTYFGAPDLLINNAAIINRNAPLWEVPPDELNAVIDVNLKGVCNVMRVFIPAMIEAESGIIVNLSSGWGRSVSPEVAPYCCTKFGIEGLTLALAEELPHGLAAIPLNPGVINTDMLKSCFGPEGAASAPSADEWSDRAATFILRLGPSDNGSSLTIP